ncbi:MAG: hypothetical protein Q4D91_03795 [Lautropia sp.]|nr:hypothetical protein [Lautropia sp.]
MMKKAVLGACLVTALSGCGSDASGVVGELAGAVTGALAQNHPYKNWTLDHEVLAASWQAIRVSVGNAAMQSVMSGASQEYVGYSGACPKGGTVSIMQDSAAQSHYRFNGCIAALVPGLALTGGVEANGAVRQDMPLTMSGQWLGTAAGIQATEGVLRGKSSGANNLGSSMQKARFTLGTQTLMVNELHFDANFVADQPDQFSLAGMNGTFNAGDAHYLVITKTRMDWHRTQHLTSGRLEVLVTKGGETIRHNIEFKPGEIISYHPGTKEPHRTRWDSAEMRKALAKYGS